MTHDEIKKRWFETRQRNPNPLADIVEALTHIEQLLEEIENRIKEKENVLLPEIHRLKKLLANPNEISETIYWEHNDYDLKLKFQLSERQRQENELLTKIAEAADVKHYLTLMGYAISLEEYTKLYQALSAWRKWKESK